MEKDSSRFGSGRFSGKCADIFSEKRIHGFSPDGSFFCGRVFAKTYCRIAEKQVFRRKNPGFPVASQNFILPEQTALFCV